MPFDVNKVGLSYLRGVLLGMIGKNSITNKMMSHIELFAGCGGLSLGLETYAKSNV